MSDFELGSYSVYKLKRRRNIVGLRASNTDRIDSILIEDSITWHDVWKSVINQSKTEAANCTIVTPRTGDTCEACAL